MSKGFESRLAAFDLIKAVSEEGAYANLVTPQVLEKSKLSEQDKAFSTELVYSTIRMSGKYDFLITHYSERDISEIDIKLLILLRLGAHQIFGMRTPIHAAINETVEVGKKVVGQSKASFLNALLRRFSEITDLDDFIDAKVKDPIDNSSIKYSHPRWIIQSYLDRLNDLESVNELLRANNVAAAPNLIAWPNLSTKEEILTEGGKEIDFTRYGVEATKPPHLYKSINERRAGVQDAGSQYVVEMAFETSHSDSKWLDMCAAPGGKAKYLYELLQGKNFQANEINEKRFNLLKKYLPVKVLTNKDGTQYGNFNSKFDRILIDAPCTGLGALRRRPEARWRKTPNDLKTLVKLQSELLQSAAHLLEPGGVIAYATCSPHLLETKVQIADFLHRHKEFRIRPIEDAKRGKVKGLESDGSLQLWTHRDGTDSMFLVLLESTT